MLRVEDWAEIRRLHRAVLTTGFDDSPKHFHEVQRVVRKARRSGFASVAVDETFLYAAIYDGDGLDPNRLAKVFPALVDHLLSSGILDEAQPERNSLVIAAVPERISPFVQSRLPYYLFDLPQSTIIDMLHGRMTVLNIVNAGRVAMAMENAGYEVAYPSGRNDLCNGSLVVSAPFDDENGRPYVVELHNLQWHIDEMLLEFKPSNSYQMSSPACEMQRNCRRNT